MSAEGFVVEDLLADAREAAGLSDFGDPRFRIGLEVLAETLDRNLRTPEARAKQRQQLCGWLQTRLRIQEACRRHPEIHDEKIIAPMIVTGLPRAGTSALFNLLNSDPDARALLLWEATFPDPVEGLQEGEEDPRYMAMKAHMEANSDPEFDKIHYVRADTPEECVILQVYSFDGALRGWEICLQPYNDWFRGHSLDFLYEEQLAHMKLLQWQRPGVRWLIKAPSHLWGLQAILESFPDASIVWGHRDPRSVIPSICSLQAMVYEQSVGKMDGAARTGFGNTVLNWYAESLERALGFRAGAGGEHFVDYGFREFVDNPKAVVDRIYSHFDIAMSPDTERALLEHAAQHKKGQHGVHEYSLENYGLDDSTVRDRFAFYMEHPLI